FSYLFTIHRPLRSTLFPYTTLFRSARARLLSGVAQSEVEFCDMKNATAVLPGQTRTPMVRPSAGAPLGPVDLVFPVLHGPFGERSEEHTSELQSRFDLVCRLLLEKK